jgi:cytochrome c oxidase cbb3-type subunit III
MPRSGLAARAAAARVAAALVAAALVGAGCEREARPFTGRTAADAAAGARGSRNPYSGNAWGIAEGKRLYGLYNCVGCHANGGGGMGPALMDERWLYGSDDASVFQTIAKGRPNGMPAFSSRVPESQIWMLAAYVQSMSGRLPMDVLPGRADHMRVSAPENARGARPPLPRGRP